MATLTWREMCGAKGLWYKIYLHDFWQHASGTWDNSSAVFGIVTVQMLLEYIITMDEHRLVSINSLWYSAKERMGKY
jgi:hypothetical protein